MGKDLGKECGWARLNFSRQANPLGNVLQFNYNQFNYRKHVRYELAEKEPLHEI